MIYICLWFGGGKAPYGAICRGKYAPTPLRGAPATPRLAAFHKIADSAAAQYKQIVTLFRDNYCAFC